MKTFQTIKQAANFISKHNESTSRKEKDINGVVMFGMGCVYAYRKEAAKAGLCKYDHSSAFYHIKNEEELLTLLSWLQDNDGYLIAA
ncbi:hypothetical protein [uncultured Duncaniella sp.]|uniref:hypothetical protein n=2 Tax=Muribaculaceae TaxID=2005473 RepID=UPI00271218EC|nr:hypothetical protein [uncultured Duncaniella sp.]